MGRLLAIIILTGGTALALQTALPLLAVGIGLGLEVGLVVLALGGSAALLLYVRGQAEYRRFLAQEREYTIRLALLLAAHRGTLPPPPMEWEDVPATYRIDERSR